MRSGGAENLLYLLRFSDELVAHRKKAGNDTAYMRRSHTGTTIFYVVNTIAIVKVFFSWRPILQECTGGTREDFFSRCNKIRFGTSVSRRPLEEKKETP